MNSKQRTSNAIALRPVDKIPLGLYLMDHDVISKIIGRKTYLRNPCDYYPAVWDGRRDEAVESMKRDLTELYRKLDCVDLITFKEAKIVEPRGYVPDDPPRKISDDIYEDSRGNAYQICPESNSFKQIKTASKTDDPQEYDKSMFEERALPDAPDSSIFELLDHLVETFGDERYIAGYSSGITALTLLGGMENGMMTLALQPDAVIACNRQKVFRQNYLDQFYIRAGIDGVHMEQDFGGTDAPLISPDMFRELCFPFLKERISNVKKYVSQVTFHSCGNTMPLMDMIIDSGIDAYESIQTNAKDISIKSLAEKYGRRICIWGAVPLEALISGKPEDARKAVRKNIEEAQDADGFILGPSHSIAFGTKYDNFMAMLDEFEKLR